MSVVEIEKVPAPTLAPEPPTAPAEEARERAVLELAADILMKGGWCQGEYEERGRHCAVGAISAAVVLTSNDDEWAPNVEDRVHSRFANYLATTENYELADDHAGDQVIYWNDAPGRTAEEVIRRMKEAAAWQ